ncbi:undecaprenyldiphospho-muramoylpentapeptide beta-N-acetylglucosaminyltransferase [Bittarella massiliensis (ex Durand et al. 2017)]|uniref:undecaprenyldiphospho-muramoylpentapeptide beta-N-acetylglucosaminyltransferase n=1 Tax=Bittarella massiliensis (ex Durand et al. 2017) TaxID=1720313 RepID=UPI001AA12E55|nr:undecaprenyldiphospho-muramoylpentapeptide beta-N-acetylglucosaminyltransferase [Bittarella massiliensis (ex Durand et al. 2017)]MBO1679409.1 undecaprenyldiphospho-muramoylpentapeptide beta-N-acetylglucosaminyltransferase [Bittarella massiliensis (ex Durand et al. 2017)]
MRILLAGGGTAGHINPAIAIANTVKKHHPDAEIAFVGNKGSMEERLVGREGYPLYTMKVLGFRRSFSPGNIAHNLQALGCLAASPGRCKKILRDFAPDLVVGTGGYVAGPILQAAAKQGIKTAIHEQNAFPGITNKLLAKEVDKVLLAVPEAQRFLQPKGDCVVTGNPIRESVLLAMPKESRAHYQLEGKICILSFGGSLGARPLNEVVADLMAYTQKHCPNVCHIHAYGGNGRDAFVARLRAGGVELPRPGLDCREYIEDMDRCLAAADIVISRAGAITLSEIEAAGKAAILIPSPYVAENHQFKNAQVLERAGAAAIIEEKDLTGPALIAKVRSLIEHPETIEAWGKASSKLAIVDANERIYRELAELLAR